MCSLRCECETQFQGHPIGHSLFLQVTAEDINLDGRLDLIAQDISGNVLCFSTTGEVIWETQVTGSRPSGSRVADLDLDGKLEVILATENGYVLPSYM